jgi:hypothetical protein
VVYLVPSLWVNAWVTRCPDSPRHRYPLKATASRLCKERWDHLTNLFLQDRGVLRLTKAVPKEAAWT